MNADLTKKKCAPCEGGTPPLSAEQIAQFLPQVKEWQVVGQAADPASGGIKKISKNFKFKDFAQAMQFVNAVARVAEADGHHPDIIVHYNNVELILWTHAIGGLSENDFIVAAKINAIKIDPKHISIDEFFKSEIKMGKILTAEKIEGADKLLKLTVDMGGGEIRTIASGVAQFYQPEDMIGKTVPVIANLAPRVMRGVESKGMILMADSGGPVLLVPIREVSPGSIVK